jgi:tRNA pseudouridine55 synthase
MMTDKELHPKHGMMLLIDKPKEFSSAKIVNIIKKKLNIKKAGHSGTLDPKASGLMIVCTDGMTKDLKTFLDFDKEYEGIMVLGKSTASFDSETEVTIEFPVNNISEEQIFNTANMFIGDISQVPPPFSAVKYKGKPLYKYARKNHYLEVSPRQVLIKEFEITNISIPEVSFRVLCSKGTYIRSLVNDFGKELGVGAYLTELRRIKIGKYNVKDSIPLEHFLLGENSIYNN